MANFVHDTFTDSDSVLLENHTGQTGATWTKLLSGGAAIFTNKVHGNDTNTNCFYKASGTPAGANYKVTLADVMVNSTTAFYTGGALLRIVDSSNFYWSGYQSGGTPGWIIAVRSAGVDTSLGTFAETLSSGNTRTAIFSIVGSTLTLNLNGTDRITVTDSTFSSAGNAGYFSGCGGNSGSIADGLWCDTFDADDLAASGAAVTPGLIVTRQAIQRASNY